MVEGAEKVILVLSFRKNLGWLTRGNIDEKCNSAIRWPHPPRDFQHGCGKLCGKPGKYPGKCNKWRHFYKLHLLKCAVGKRKSQHPANEDSD
jgi:hypothetical protein